MKPIRTVADLNAEKLRLQALKTMHEQHFQEKLGTIQKRLEPYKGWLARVDKLANRGEGASPQVKNTIGVAIPLLVDKLLLGTKGLLFKQGLTWLTQFAADKIAQESPGSLAGKFFKFIPTVVRGASPLIRNLFHKRLTNKDKTTDKTLFSRVPVRKNRK